MNEEIIRHSTTSEDYDDIVVTTDEELDMHKNESYGCQHPQVSEKKELGVSYENHSLNKRVKWLCVVVAVMGVMLIVSSVLIAAESAEDLKMKEDIKSLQQKLTQVISANMNATKNVSEIESLHKNSTSKIERLVLELEDITAANFVNMDLEDIYSKVTTLLRAFKDQNIVNSKQNIEYLRSIFQLSTGHSFVSCSVIQQNFPSFPSGYYQVRSANGSAVNVYCDMTSSCGGFTGGWMRVAVLDMRNTSTQCPSGFIERTNSSLHVRYCIQNNFDAACSATNYQTNGIMYSQVCGMIRAYQIRYPDGFVGRSDVRPSNPILDSNYVDGVSLTHGTSSKEHIWSLAASVECTCSRNRPSFVGNDFSCDGIIHPQCEGFCGTVLWDGEGCQSNNSPWFYKQLTQSTTDDIEMRVCRDEPISDEDIAIEIIEILVQ